MGNRANVIFEGHGKISPAVYLHWNGGPESVYAFLRELEARGMRKGDPPYEVGRFVQLVGEFFDDHDGKRYEKAYCCLSLGVTNGPRAITAEALAEVNSDDGDNGFYVVNRTTGKVRRFKSYYGPRPGQSGIRALSAAEVKAEHTAAVNDETYRGIGEFFDNLDARLLRRPAAA